MKCEKWGKVKRVDVRFQSPVAIIRMRERERRREVGGGIIDQIIAKGC